MVGPVMKVSGQSDLGTGNIWTYRADCIAGGGAKVKAATG